MSTTAGGGMFGEAFNLFSGGVEIQKLRMLLQNVGAQMYSVKPECTDKHNFSELQLPNYYIKANDDILKFSTGNTSNQLDNTTLDEFNKFNKFNIKQIFQDITDKDNLASLAIIGQWIETQKFHMY